MILLAAGHGHGQPNGVIVWGLAVATWALLVLIAYALYRARAARVQRRPAEPPITRMTIQPRAIEPYEPTAWTAGPDPREEPQ